jgi:hypothetical protein
LVLVSYLISLSPASPGVSFLLSPASSLLIGFVLGCVLLLRGKPVEWVYTFIYIVILEQMYIVGSSFVDEMIILVLSVRIFQNVRHSLPVTFTFVFLFFTFCCISSGILNSIDLPVVIAGTRSYMQYAILFLILHRSGIDLNEMEDVFKTIVYCGIFFSLVAIANLLIGNISLVGRSEGVLSNPNALAGYLIFAVPVLWVHFSDKTGFSWLKRLRFRYVGVFTFIAFVATGSRAMIIGLVLGLTLVTLCNRGNFKQKIKLVLFLSFIACIGFYITEGKVLDRFLLLQSKHYLSSETNVRVYYTEQAIRLLKENLLFGVGPGRYGGSVATIFPSPVYEEYGIRSPKEWAGIIQGDVFYPHLLAELGLIGTIFFCIMVFCPIWSWVSGVLSNRVRWTPLGGACAASMIALAVATVGGPYLELHLTALFFWLFMYVLVLETRNQNSPRYRAVHT